MSSHQPTPPPLQSRFGDRHVIDTPEQVQLQFAIAGIGSRFLAVAIDTIIQVVVLGGIGLILGFLGVTGFFAIWRQMSLWLWAGLIAFFFLLYFGYFAFFEILWGGQTPGKRTIGIRVIKETGRPLSPSETIARNLMRIVDQMPGFYAVAVLTAMFNDESKRLGDFVAGSIVVREHSLDEMRGAWSAATAPSVSRSLLGANRLTAEEVSLIDTFLVRRHELAHDVRSHMAYEILRRLEPKLTLTEDDRAGVEATLRSIAYEHRSAARY
jgi:uncharacterized RDD family membrane protein YckC